MKNTNPITWFEVNNIIPIVVSLITMALAFAALNTRVMLIDQKVDTLLTQQKEMLVGYNAITLKIQALETMHGK